MTRISLLLVSITVSLSLGASQSQDKKPKSTWPWEVQIGADFMGYNSHEATANGGKLTFSASNPRLAPSVRLSIDPICLPFGSILFSAGYKFGNDVPLDYDGTSARADLKHKDQIQVGALLRFKTSGNFEFGAGLDARYDWMKATHRVGTMSQSIAWRPWLRADARYMFDKGTRVTPFVGLELAYALTKNDVKPENYYRDYFINSGDAPLGTVTLQPSPESYTRGNFPAWEAVIKGGIRFGRRDNCAPAPVVPIPVVPKQEPIVVKEAPVKVVERQVDDSEAKAREAERLEREAAALAERLAREAEERERLAREAAAAVVPVQTREPEKVVEPVRILEVEAIRIHFPTNGFAETAENRAIIKVWAAKYKNVVEPSAIIITGHCDDNGSAEHNRVLSANRANSLAESLRKEGIVVPRSNIIGHSSDKPIADNHTPEGLAKNRRAELTVNGSKYTVTSMTEGRMIVER